MSEGATKQPVVSVDITLDVAFDGPGTAELVDENDEDGMVVVKDRHGSPRFFMPGEDYEALLAEARKS